MASCNRKGSSSEEKDEQNASSSAMNKDSAIIAHAIAHLDTIPYKIPDTTHFSAEKKDSLKVAIAFQKVANDMGRAYVAGDAKGYLKYVLPSLMQLQANKMGSMEKVIERYEALIDQDQGKIKKILTGPSYLLGEIINDKKQSAGWYCLMPTRTFENSGEVREGWLAGMTLDKGEHVFYLDITQVPSDKVFTLMPDLKYLTDELPE